MNHEKPHLSPLKFIHVGHHKCGSTFLQYEVLPHLHSLQQPSGKLPDGRSDLSFRRAWIALATQGDGSFDLEETARIFARKDFNCLSNEAFVGFGSVAAATGLQVPTIARRLRLLFGETKIVIVIRNQRAILSSLYMDDIEYGYLADFETWVRHRHFHHMLDWFRYAPIISAYRKEFGSENVHVVLAENLYRRETIEELMHRFGVPTEGLKQVNFGRRVNESPSGAVVWLTRQLLRHIGSPANMGRGRLYDLWIDRGRWTLDRIARRLGAGRAEYNFLGYEDIIQQTFHADNLLTAEMTGLDLAGHEYP